MIKKALYSIIISILFCCCLPAKAQIGVSYFFPEHGSFSVPVAPFSYTQQITFRRVQWIKLIPGAAIYTIGGMSVKGLPDGYNGNQPLMGPFHSVMLSFMPALSLPLGSVDIDFQGGYFGCYNILPQINEGNFDRMLAKREGWDACTSDFSFKNNIAHGFVFGMTFNIWISRDRAICPGVMYYMGGSKLDLNGSYTGGKLGDPVVTKTASFSDSKLNYRGFEVQIGLQL
ncbi:MAG: hypothetical protein WCM76_04920 [Bacteroidota bacterium]